MNGRFQGVFTLPYPLPSREGDVFSPLPWWEGQGEGDTKPPAHQGVRLSLMGMAMTRPDLLFPTPDPLKEGQVTPGPSQEGDFMLFEVAARADAPAGGLVPKFLLSYLKALPRCAVLISDRG